MKTFATSVSLLAISTSVLSAANTSVLSSQQSTKPWSVAASLRGFYDDNINSSPDGLEQDSFGGQVNPTINYGILGERTTLNLRYDLSAKWYDNPYPNWTSPWQLAHTLEGAVSHTFNPRISVTAKDSFVIGQEPDVLQVANSPFATSQTITGDNKRNYAALDVNLQATSLLGFQVGYGNLIYNYDDGGDFSNSALLDRMHNIFHLDSRWTLHPQTVGILGYMFTDVGYTSDSIAGITGFPPTAVYSDTRNARGNTIYVGAEHNFTPDLSAQLNGGVQIYDYYNDPAAETSVSPYAQGSMRYMYRATSSLEAGVSLMRTPTDAFSPTASGSFVLDAQSLVFYGAWVHEILPRLYSNVNGSFQQSKFNGGSLDDDSDYYYRVGLSVAYEFSKYVSASVGYNWDQADSDDPSRAYNRNRVYLGVTAAY